MAGGGGLTTALLKKTTENNVVEEDELGMKEKVWIESKKLWVVAAPAIFTRFSTFGVSLISQAFIGHWGPIELAAYSITFTALLRFSNGILEKLQRSWIVLTCCTICLMLIYIFSGPILLALGQEEHIVRVARIIALWVIGINFSFVSSFTCQIFLQAQSKNKIIAYVAVVSLCVHVFLSWLLMVHFDFGITGAMTSTLVAFWLPNIAQLLFVTRGGCKDTWRGFSMLAFKDLWPVFKLSLSSGGMLCLELWYNSILVLLTGNLKNAEVALDALAICININGLEMMIALGFLAAASVRVFNELGRGNAKGAKYATKKNRDGIDVVETAVESLDLTAHFRLKYCKDGDVAVGDDRLVILDETQNRELQDPGFGVLQNISAVINCDSVPTFSISTRSTQSLQFCP